MASSKRKQDEKHLKILRELVSKPENRTCFDCHQKGPTYVNMMIGSFICTSCSGILRGLNPPHRVKSISMASFTSEEVEQIKMKGNKYCQAVWLGLYDGKSNIFSDTKDEHKIRDFMISKYEKKRFYVDPSVAIKSGGNLQAKSESSSSASTPGSDNRSLGSVVPNSTASVSRPIASVQNSGSSPNLNGLHQGSSLKLSPSVDLLSRLGNSASGTQPKTQQRTSDKDPFSSAVTSQGTTEGFANFENANIFSTVDSPLTFPLPPTGECSPPPLYFPPDSPFTPLSLSPPASPCNPHPILILPTNAESSSLSSSPTHGEYEDELSAAMPLLPTGEVPPTWQGSSPSSPSQKASGGSPLIFAAGVSAQYVAPSVDGVSSGRQPLQTRQEQTQQSREGRSSSLPLNLCELGQRKQPQRESSLIGLALLASFSSSFSNLFPARSRSNSKGKNSKKTDRKCWDEAVSRRDFDDPEDELSPAMPLLSLDPEKAERSYEVPLAPSTLQQTEILRKCNHNLSVPLSSSFDETESHEASPMMKTNSSLNLSCKVSPDVYPTFLRKVSSSQNLTTDGGSFKREKNRPLLLQLSAIPNRVRARIMSEEDLQLPKNRLSSSLPDSSPLASRRSFDALDTETSDPVTVVYSKQLRDINQASFFTNTSSDFSNLDLEGTVAKTPSTASLYSNSSNPINPHSPSPVSPRAKHGWMLWDTPVVINQPNSSDWCGMVEEKTKHASLPSLSNLNDDNTCFFPINNAAAQMTRVSSECSISMANLTSLASRFVAGASISKPSPNPPRLPFSSNPLTPLISSSSSAPKSISTSSPNNASSPAVPAANSSSLAVSEDRYAALKDLDEAFKVQKEVDKPSGNNSVMFGSPPAGTNQPQPGNPSFGTSPISSCGNFYPNSSMSKQGWNATFSSVNPFSGNGSFNANFCSAWPNSSNFGSLSTQVQAQVNPFAGGADPNFNSQFVPAFGAASTNNTNSNLPGFGSSPNVQNGSNKLNTNPWGSSSPPNPFSVPLPVVPSGGSSYNPFL